MANLTERQSLTAADVAFFVGLVLLPLDSAPFFPVDTQSRPLSVVFFLCSLFLRIAYRQKLSLAGVRFSLLFVASVIYGCALYGKYQLFDQAEVIRKTAIVAPVAFIMGLATIEFFQKSAKSVDVELLVGRIGKAFFISFLLILPIIIIQALGRLHVLDTNFVSSVTSFFSYRTVPDRIQGVSGETAQGLRYLFLFGVFCLFGLKRKLGQVVVIVILFVTALSGSVFGIAFVGITLGIYFSIFVLPGFELRKILNLGAVVLLFLALIRIMFLEFANEYTLNKIELLSNVVVNADIFGTYLASSGDGSAFLRIVNPVIGWYMFLDSKMFGVGPHAYHLHYIELVIQRYPEALLFEAVDNVATGTSYITAKSMVAKVLAEFGAVGLATILFVFLASYRNLNNFREIAPEYDQLNKLLFSLLVALFFFTESYIYFPFYFLFGYFLVFLPINQRSNQQAERLAPITNR